MDLRDQYPRLPLPLMVNNTCYESHCLGGMNVLKDMTCGKLTALGKWDVIGSCTGLLLLS